MLNFWLCLVLVQAAHSVGTSQGTISVTHGDADVVVEIELVFARADDDAFAAAAVAIIVTGDGVACALQAATRQDVEEDGRAMRIVATCPRRTAAIDVDVVGLRGLDEQHRMLLRIIDDGGDRATMLWSASTTTALQLRSPSPDLARLAPGLGLVAVLALCLWGARRRRPIAMTVTGAMLAGVGVWMVAPATPPHPVLLGVVGVAAIFSVWSDPQPRLRPVGWAVAGLLMWIALTR